MITFGRMKTTPEEQYISSFRRLVEVVHELRIKCPWDREQTKESIRHLSIEEVYELSDAILKNDNTECRNELGDLLLHIILYARMGEEQGHFDLNATIIAITEKLIRRHPHIYGDVQADNSATVIKNWEEIKMQEKKGTKASVLAGVPNSMPALIKAWRMQEKARNVGFDWEKPEQVWEKVQEELNEFKAELKQENPDQGRIEGEFGDLLFSLVNYARFINVNPEDALEKTNLKFRNRFEYMEGKILDEGRKMKEMTLEELDNYWNDAKKLEGKQS